MMEGQDRSRNAFMLTGPLAHSGYDWWWHSFTAHSDETGEERAFFLEFFTVNPALGGAEPVFGQSPEHEKPSYLMVKVGTWGEDGAQLHRFFGWDSVLMHEKEPFSVCAEDCFLSETESRGTVRVENAAAHPEWMCDDGEISWSLTIDKKIAFNVGYGASKPFRVAEAFEMYWHAEGMKTLYSGWVTYNGKRYSVTPETSYGYADKNWGRDFTSPWIWLASCNLTSRVTGRRLENTVFDIGGGRPKVYFLPLEQKLLGAVSYEGTLYEFNFSKLWTLAQTQFDCRETDTQILWSIRQETIDAVLMIDASCEKKDMLLVNYESPDGEKRHNRLWNGGNGVGRVQLYRKTRFGIELIDDMDARNIGCEYGEYDH